MVNKAKKIYPLNNLIIVFIAAFVMLMLASAPAHAASVPSASGQVDSNGGAYLRSSASTSSKKIALLADDTSITIYKEQFVTTTSTKATNKWYYIKAGGEKGYIRSDLVDNIQYGSVNGKLKARLNYRKGAGVKMKRVGSLKKGKKITVCLKAVPVSSTAGSSKTWYKIKKGSKYYYVCSGKVKLTGGAVAAGSSDSSGGYVSSPATDMTDKEFEAYMTSQGFPESYKAKLRTLHKAHPNWGFVAYKTGISWSAALKAESKKGVSLVSGSYPSSYRSSNTAAEKGWYYANSTVVGYYMDPRNFLNENSIYMFEDLSYKSAYQTSAVVSKILEPTKLPSCGFTAALFVKAGANNNVSPVFLAARARQETGSGGTAVNGKSKLGKVYNPFNIGAYGGTDPLYQGLLYAKAAGWTTPEKALNGGAAMLAKYYINKGQYTTYYQRFNARNGASKIGTHQYMTNIMAPYTESLSTKKSYATYGITEQSLVFEIPIYDSMPGSTKLP